MGLFHQIREWFHSRPEYATVRADSHFRGHCRLRSRAVANQLIRLAKQAGRRLTPMQIIKLVYIAHGWMLGLYQRPLISEPVEAWQYGPVVPDVYHQLKKYGSNFVEDELYNGSDGELGEIERDLIDQVFKVYGALSGIRLSQITHQPGTPWEVTWTESGKNAVISNDVIAEHYQTLANERRATQSS